MRNSLAIKNLSIALEALSRIPGSECENKSTRIHDLLDDVLKEEEQGPLAHITTTTLRNKPDEDEIPF